MTALDLHARRAVEALRAGVPNRDAVSVLGSGQSRIEAKFAEALDLAQDDLPNARQTPGLLIAGGFGAGKSHLLEHLQHLALQQNFICSKVVISKETPLFDPARFYRAAIRSAVVPKRTGDALTEVAFSLKFDSAEVAALNTWANQPDRELNSRFPASLYLFEHVRDDEWRSKLISFWSGDPINAAELRRLLRAHSQAATYPLEKVTLAELPFQRFAFAPRLMVAAGYSGWVLLVDEVELIGRYSFRQRARSYAALARWAGKLTGESYPGLLTLFAIVTEFEQAVLLGKNDVERIPGRLGATDLDADRLLASQAERGMRFLSRERLDLQRPDAVAVAHTYQQLRELHGRAYDWPAPEIQPGERLPSTSMREYVRRWINEWDLRRLYPDEAVELGGEHLELDFSESAELEAPEEPERDLELPFQRRAMPIAFRDALDVEELGPAAYLAVEPEPDGRALRGALFLVDARGEPLEFVYNRIELPETFLWRRADLRRHAERRLAASLLAACPRTPRLLLARADQVGSELFCEDLAVDLAVGRIGLAGSANAYTPREELELVERPAALQLFWFPARPLNESLERQLFEHLRDHGLLLEPFERAGVGIDEAYGASVTGREPLDT